MGSVECEFDLMKGEIMIPTRFLKIFLYSAAVAALIAITFGICVWVKPKPMPKTKMIPAELQLLKLVAEGQREKLENFPDSEEIPFAKMPSICQEQCKEEKELYEDEANTATVIKKDLDGDGTAEWLVTYRHYSGNGGTNYDVLTCNNGVWKKCGKLFAVSISYLRLNDRTGIFEVSKSGYSHRAYTFYELIKGKLVPTIKLETDLVDSSDQETRIIKLHFSSKWTVHSDF